MQELSIRSKKDGSIALISIAGEARLERIGDLRKEAKTLRDGGTKHVLLDIRGLQFADSASVGVFLEIHQACANAGGRFVICGAPPRLAKQIADMGLEKRFSMAPDEATARKSLPP